MTEKAIYARLTTDGMQTKAIVGAAVYPDLDMADDERFVVYAVDKTTSAQTMSGPSGLLQSLAVVSVVGPTRIACEALADAVRADLDGQSGTWGGVVVQGAFLDDSDTNVYPLSDGGERRKYAKDLKFTVWSED